MLYMQRIFMSLIDLCLTIRKVLAKTRAQAEQMARQKKVKIK